METGTESKDFPRTITVEGVGTVSAKPDLATINTGVTTEAKTAEEALAENNKQFQKVLDILKEKGIAEQDIQTSSFNVRPRFARPRDGVPDEIIGYEVTNRVQVRVRDIDRLGEILDAVVNAGSNRVSDIFFNIADPQPLLDKARTAAVQDAKRKAELFACAADVKVGKVLSISENPVRPPQPQFRAEADFLAKSSVPIASGELDIQENVFILFQIL